MHCSITTTPEYGTRTNLVAGVWVSDLGSGGSCKQEVEGHGEVREEDDG